ncbi:hypothetical protein ACJX0J_020312 [Zea mays]
MEEYHHVEAYTAGDLFILERLTYIWFRSVAGYPFHYYCLVISFYPPMYRIDGNYIYGIELYMFLHVKTFYPQQPYILLKSILYLLLSITGASKLRHDELSNTNDNDALVLGRAMQESPV